MRGFSHRSRIRQLGFSRDDFAGKPVIAILNTWSEINPCHYHLRERAEAVKRGVWQAGGFPVEIPALSITETYMKPSPMLYRNLLALETEEILRSLPIDGSVLMGGCDKTTPGLLMGAISMNLPSIFLPAGPMLRGNWNGQALGSGTDLWKFWTERCAGSIDAATWEQMEGGIARSPGHCMTMGTASTMTGIAEAMGLTLAGASSIPAPDSNHIRMAMATGRRIVDMVWTQQTLSTVLTQDSFDNGIVACSAMAGSTNAIIHLVAMAGRCGFDLPLERFDAISAQTPVLADIRPSGRFLMEDFYYAGGLPALLSRIRDLLHLECMTVSGNTVGEQIQNAKVLNDEVIRPLDRPLRPDGATVVLRGNLAPDGAIIKPAAADSNLIQHRGRALVFDSMADLEARVHDPDLPVTKDTVLVLRNAGPLGGPGMPEWGMLPIPKKLLDQGIRDMVRISDARMSGTAYGACVVHVAPESYIGGPLALVRNGDWIELDVPRRTLRIDLPESELARRKQEWRRPAARYARGYGSLYAERVTQANLGCDFDFLQAGEEIPEPAIF